MDLHDANMLLRGLAIIDSVERLFGQLPPLDTAHFIDVEVREGGQFRRYQGDVLKEIQQGLRRFILAARAEPPVGDSDTENT